MAVTDNKPWEEIIAGDVKRLHGLETLSATLSSHIDTRLTAITEWGCTIVSGSSCSVASFSMRVSGSVAIINPYTVASPTTYKWWVVGY